MRAKDALGRYGEDVAVRHLAAAGLVILERNWRCDSGEIDIVAREDDALVVCEVKTRTGVGFGHPAEAVTPRKAVRLRLLATRWLAAHEAHPAEIRFDVVSVLRPRRGPTQVEHIRGVLG
ncbi:YraN family protein [soil metagenome]